MKRRKGLSRSNTYQNREDEEEVLLCRALERRIPAFACDFVYQRYPFESCYMFS